MSLGSANPELTPLLHLLLISHCLRVLVEGNRDCYFLIIVTEVSLFLRVLYGKRDSTRGEFSNIQFIRASHRQGVNIIRSRLEVNIICIYNLWVKGDRLLGEQHNSD